MSEANIACTKCGVILLRISDKNLLHRVSFDSYWICIENRSELIRFRYIQPVKYATSAYFSWLFRKTHVSKKKKTRKKETELHVGHINNFYSQRFRTDVRVTYSEACHRVLTVWFRIYLSTHETRLQLIPSFDREKEKKTSRGSMRASPGCFTRHGIKLAQLQLLWQQFKTLGKYFRCTNSFLSVYLHGLRSLSRC